MRVHFVHHAEDRAFVAEVARVMAGHRFEPADAAQGSDLAVVVASKAALRDGLGAAPLRALAAGVRTATVLLGEDALPDRFPVPHKHVPLVRDVASMLRLLEDHRRTGAAKIAEGKREMLGYGVLLALLGRA
jgi:hypothetical protein